MKFNSKYQHTRQDGIKFTKPSLTDQSQLYSADINNIINGMVVPMSANKPPQFGIEFNVDSYQESLNIVAEANSRFEELPANVRREFHDNPKELIEFIDNCDSKEKALKGVKLGIFEKSFLDKFKEDVKPIVESSDETITPVSDSE